MKIHQTLPSGIQIVEYEPSLAKSLAHMWNASREDWGGSTQLKTEAQILNDHKASSNYNTFVAMDGDKAVGYCSFGPYFYDGNTAYIPLLGVHPAYKNKKIGKALVLLAVNRAIQLGYPRLDLYTWAGNTAAMPLYKKCGFMWEDRPDSVHLANFIPSIVTEPLFQPFFAGADWYADSTRGLDISPDGVAVNKFETFTYAWEKDGQTLKVAFERTGRGMYMVETNDYKVEMMPQSHKLAFGQSYPCAFTVENKSGKPLDVTICGKSNDSFIFEPEGSSFFVNPVETTQDPWKTYPTLEAEVTINGHTLTFAMGIEALFPITATYVKDNAVSQIGATHQAHINLESNLTTDATFDITLPDNPLLDFAQTSHQVNIAAGGKACISVDATTKAMGFARISLQCGAHEIPMFVHARDFTTSYYGEDFESHYLTNGPWQLELTKTENHTSLTHLTYHHSIVEVEIAGCGAPELGEPFSNEFDLSPPAVTVAEAPGFMIMYVKHASGNFPGLTVTQVYKLSQSGVITRHHVVENTGETTHNISLKDKYYIQLKQDTMYGYQGKITQTHDTPQPDGDIMALDATDPDNIDSHWVFNADPNMTRGCIWPPAYRPAIKWGQNLHFTIPIGTLAPGQSFATAPITYVLGLFHQYTDFVQYATGTAPTQKIPTKNLDIHIQPLFLQGDQKPDFTATSNRAADSSGNIITMADFAGGSPVEIATVNIHTDGYKKSIHRAIFTPSGQVTTAMEGGSLVVSNGAITYKVDPAYGHVCYSLTDAAGQEYLLNRYPNHEPLSWWNPFLGGICSRPDQLNISTILKEDIHADFATIPDNMGNHWQGICITLQINKYEKLAGQTYKTYLLTLPGLPLLCTYFQIENHSHQYVKTNALMASYFNTPAGLASFGDKHQRHYHMHLGTEESNNMYYQDMLKISTPDQNNIYQYYHNKHSQDVNLLYGNNKVPAEIYHIAEVTANHGETFTSPPSFTLITPLDLPQGALDSLASLEF